MQNSTIEWTDHTFNPWHGCFKVSPGCQHCYAETMNHRYGFHNWGPAKTTQRRKMSANYWQQPLKWDRLAQVSGRKRVFCASMADVFEDHPQVDDWRADLWDLIRLTPNLDWLLLTKRPENILAMIPVAWRHGPAANVWYGTSVENQEYADMRIPELLKVPAKVRFLSCEPLLGPVTLCRWIRPSPGWAPDPIHWVIAGGESGHDARPIHPDWVQSLRDECQAAGDVSFFFKQWGEYEPYEEDAQPPFWNDQHGKMHDGHWLDILNPETGEVNRGWHEDSLHSPYAFRRVGKHAAGRSLDGRTYDEFPT
jgi:protein gp37